MNSRFRRRNSDFTRAGLDLKSTRSRSVPHGHIRTARVPAFRTASLPVAGVLLRDALSWLPYPQDLQSNGDVIVVEEVRTHKGQTWYRVRISAGKQQGSRFSMLDTVGWLREQDVSNRGAQAIRDFTLLDSTASQEHRRRARDGCPHVYHSFPVWILEFIRPTTAKDDGDGQYRGCVAKPTQPQARSISDKRKVSLNGGVSGNPRLSYSTQHSDLDLSKPPRMRAVWPVARGRPAPCAGH